MSHTSVGQQGLQRPPHPLVGQKLLGSLMLQQHTEHSLGFMAMSGICVPRDTEAQQGLCR